MEHKIDSSNISQISYNKDTSILTVFFKNNTVYEYHPVFKQQIDDFLISESKGKWLNENIKKNKTVSVKKIK